MRGFSGFAPFGLFEFGGGDLFSYTIYQNELRNIGYDENFSGDENLKGKLLADAILHAIGRAALDKAFNEAHPLSTIDYLSTHEYETGITPLPTQTEGERRRVLYNTKRLLIDGKYTTIHEALKQLLGASLVFYRATRVAELPVSAFFDTVDQQHSLYSGWAIPVRIDRLVMPITRLYEEVEVVTELVAGHREYYTPKQLLLCEPGSNSRSERAVAKRANGNSTGGSFVASFTRPHDAGALLTSGHYPRESSDMRRHQIVLTASAALDRNVRYAIDTVMKRLVRGTDVWQICEETTSNATGPFKLDSNHLDACTLGVVTP